VTCRQYGFSPRLAHALTRLASRERSLERSTRIALAELLLAVDSTAAALALLDDVDALVSGTGDVRALAECQRLRGLIAVADDKTAVAGCWSEMAIATARQQRALLFESRGSIRARIDVSEGLTTKPRPPFRSSISSRPRRAVRLG